MDYLDFVTSGRFRTAQDGRKLFYPWGWGRGYVIASEQQYNRLRRQQKTSWVGTLVLVLWINAAFYSVYTRVTHTGPGPLLLVYVVLACLAFFSVFQMVWTLYRLGGLQQSDEKLSLKEAMSSRARVLGPGILWLGEIGSLTFVGSAIFMLVVDPPPHGLGRAALALGVIAFFGLCAAVFMRMIVLLRSVSHQ
jgi:hypothetical protein